MKFTKILSAAAASAAAMALLAAGVSAYDLNKDLRTGWSISTTVPASEFEGATTDSVFTLTITVDESLADMEGHNYWCVKPMINDEGWPFINNLVGPALSDGGDSYPVEPGQTEVKFTIPAEELEHLQVAGMAFMGHGVTLGTLTYSNDETLDTSAPAEEAAPAAEVEAAAEVTTAAATTTSNPKTGVTDIFAFGFAAAGSLALAGAAAKRRK